MLKEFRSIDVYWDKATRRIYEEIRSSSSDEKGRKLTVQIVNDGQIQDLTNVALNLYWETQDGENRGLDPFEPLDAENGIYELYFRTGMLEHVGKLNAHLHLVDTTGAITSEPFTIAVFSGVDVDAMASDDELSALNQALIEVQNIKQDEAERVSAETERIAAEEERKTAETARATAENTRNTNETGRVDNEEDRVAAESDRIDNEEDRLAAETERVTAENARVTAEEEREQGYPALDTRLTAVEQNIVFENISDGFSFASGVTNFHAYKFGRVVFMRFDYQPVSTGFNRNVVNTTLYKPRLRTAVTVGTSQSSNDSAIGITSLFLTTGELRVVAPQVPGNPMLFTCVYLI